jgi:hypothetical protein
MYAEIINNTVITIHYNLPSIYNNISNFFALDKALLYDLSWSGNEGIKFYEYIAPESPPEDQTIESVSYTIDDENKKVYGINNTIPKPPPEVPENISARQIRLWLIKNGISLSTVTDAIATIENEELKESTLVEWEYAPYVERNHPLIETIGAILGLSSEQIDNAFIEAFQL